MNIQTKASFRKEFFAYFRTQRLLAIALVIVGLAVLSPLMITGLVSMVDSLSDQYYTYLGMDVTGMVEMFGSSTSIGVLNAVESITGLGLIVMLILMNKAAGGEQKTRAVIIPQSAGLRSFSYLFPKFIIYPASLLIIAIVSALAAWAVSIYIFDFDDLTFYTVLIAGTLAGVHLMLYACMHLTLGTATGRAGMSAAVCIAVSILLPTLFSMYSMDYMFNPFALTAVAQTVINSDAMSVAELLDIGISVVFVFGIMVTAFLIALFAQNAKKIDNTGNEITL